MWKNSLLGLFPLFIFILTVFSLEGVVCVHLYLLPDNFLRRNKQPAEYGPSERTDACAPVCFNVSISCVVRGWTAIPSSMSSFVASVSSENFRIGRESVTEGRTYVFHSLWRDNIELSCSNFVGQSEWLIYQVVCGECTYSPEVYLPVIASTTCHWKKKPRATHSSFSIL